MTSSDRTARWALIAVGVFYILCAAAAAFAGAQYVLITLLVALIPASGALLLIARSRSKARTASGADGRDAAPGIGFDSETPLGDTSEHSTAERVGRPDRRFG
jgi:hypothetical protein